jgi:acyl-CoA thioester hydrolase
MFVVAEVQTRYLAPARLDDLLQVTVRVEEQGAASMVIVQEAFRGDVLLAEGRIRIGCVHAESLRPCRIPARVVNALAGSGNN